MWQDMESALNVYQFFWRVMEIQLKIAKLLQAYQIFAELKQRE